MPTPNQTTPDSPERTPLQKINRGLLRICAPSIGDAVADRIEELESETTRLAEALKEAEKDKARLDWMDAKVSVAAKYQCRRPASDHDGETYWSFNWSQWHNTDENSLTIRTAIDTAMQPAPISGAKKE